MHTLETSRPLDRWRRSPARPRPGGRPLAAFALLALGLLAPAGAGAQWTARARPAGGGAGVARCVLESPRQPMPDGYQTTWAQVLVDEAAVRVTAGSQLDPSEGDLGLVVDDGAFVPADEVRDQRTAVFAARHDTLVEEFKRGLKVRVQLRFWPTWPKTGTHAATFSLIGFTRAHGQMADCRTP
jgi:hypothetical protein